MLTLPFAPACGAGQTANPGAGRGERVAAQLSLVAHIIPLEFEPHVG